MGALIGVDKEVRAAAVKRDYAIETGRKLERLRSGAYHLDVAGSEAKELSWVDVTVASPGDPTLVLASYHEGTGLTLVFNQAVRLKDSKVADPLALFYLTKDGSVIRAGHVFEPIGGAPLLWETPSGLVLAIRKKDAKEALAGYRLVPVAEHFDACLHPSGAAIREVHDD